MLVTVLFCTQAYFSTFKYFSILNHKVQRIWDNSTRTSGLFRDVFNQFVNDLCVLRAFPSDHVPVYVAVLTWPSLLVLVLVVDGLCSQSAVYAHHSVSIQSVLKSIDWCRFNNRLWQLVPFVHDAKAEEMLSVWLLYGIWVWTVSWSALVSP